MPVTLRKNTYYYDASVGDRRVRVSLRVCTPKAADRLANRVAFALADGPKSPVWGELRSVLPKSSFKILTQDLGLKVPLELSEFEHKFLDKLDRRVKMGELAPSTRGTYRQTAIRFFDRMLELGLQKLSDITPRVAEDYILWCKEIATQKGRTGRGITTVFTILQTVFNFALEEKLIEESPLRGKYKADSDPAPPTPFTVREMDKLAGVAQDDPATNLIFLIFKWTGMRCSDVAALNWGSINFDTRTLKWLTNKRKVWVTVPLASELFDVLNRGPHLSADQIIPGATRVKLYKTIKALGEKAGVEDCHPHKFRATLCCSLLAKGASLFDVAKLIGDTHGVVERYYANVSPEQQERVRGLMEEK